MSISEENITIPVCLQDFEDLARRSLPPPVYSYIIDHAGEGQTKNDCRKAFKRYRLRPRLMRDVSNRRFSTTVLGYPISLPVGISPTGGHKFVHTNGEIETAKAAASSKTLMAVSCVAMTSYADIYATVPNGLRWLQIVLFKNRELTKHYVRQAEAANFKAVVVTIDAPVFGKRTGATKGQSITSLAQREEYRIANCYNFKGEDTQSAIANGDIALWDYINKQLNDKQTWEDIKWLKSITNLPVVVKGILTGESAMEAVESGVDAIIVSVHGGRQLDGVPATIDALPEVVKAVHGTGVEVYMDGGVRTGTDVFKALALGARAVFLGRSILWGLAYDGENGVKKVLEIIRNEFSLTMALMGCSRLEDIQPSMVVHESKYLSRL